MQSREDISPPLRPQWGVFFLLGLVTSLIAFLPVGLLFNQLWTVLVFGLFGAVMSAINFGRFRMPVPYRPLIGEYILYGMEMLFGLSITGMLWILIYLILYAIIAGIHWIWLLLVPRQDWDVTSPTFWIAFFLGLLLHIISYYGFNNDSAKNLFPTVSGLKSDFYPIYTRSRKSNLFSFSAVLFFTVAPIALVVLLNWNPIILYVYLLVFMLILGATAIPASTELTAGVQATIAAVGALYKTAGFSLEEKPRTMDPKIDPLLIKLDFYAQKNRVDYFIQVIPKLEEGKSFDYNAIYALKQAGWSLSEKRGLKNEAARHQVVLVDTQPDEILQKMTQDLVIDLIQIDSQTLGKFIHMDDADPNKKRTASQLLHVPVTRKKKAGPSKTGKEEGSYAS
jgi:hypothetical protein